MPPMLGFELQACKLTSGPAWSNACGLHVLTAANAHPLPLPAAAPSPAQRNTRIGKELSGALVATLAGMALANGGYLPPHPPEANVVFKFLLLLSADLRRIIRCAGAAAQHTMELPNG